MEFGILFGRAKGRWAADDLLDLEYDAAEELDIPVGLVAIDALVDERLDDALRSLPPPCGRTWLYRGWLIKPDEYAALFEAILERGDLLFVSPDQFEQASCIPNWAPELGDHTPPTVWTDDTDAREAWDLAMDELGPPPWIIKDHVKSAKEQWDRACFVPEDATFERFADTCEALVDIRGDRFVGGLVVRKRVALRTIPFATAYGQAHEEHRLVFWNGRLIANTPYFDCEMPPLDGRAFAWLGRAIDSPFFSADIARLADGGTTVIEINDGGCTTMSDQVDQRALLRAMRRG